MRINNRNTNLMRFLYHVFGLLQRGQQLVHQRQRIGVLECDQQVSQIVSKRSSIPSIRPTTHLHFQQHHNVSHVAASPAMGADRLVARSTVVLQFGSIVLATDGLLLGQRYGAGAIVPIDGAQLVPLQGTRYVHLFEARCTEGDRASGAHSISGNDQALVAGDGRHWRCARKSLRRPIAFDLGFVFHSKRFLAIRYVVHMAQKTAHVKIVVKLRPDGAVKQ